MADEEFDICERIWNHELAMQRLLSILRQNQNYCTDDECYSLARLPGPSAAPPSNDFFMPFLIIAFMVLMYVFRPNSLRQIRNNNVKDRDNERDSSDDPPVPPPTMQ
ncbi:small integral membrane protein 14 [Megachile rotundata]|uniref:small integral membrane protein 14 n=1 Tax=Megachile rotundata TaxID=143995 RepID=UPI000258EB66|nr:PREDICTED: small integral membrane protein 14 [Megachile rotundata]XP_012147312.1 PREDICTED: small integral membrane protein 14 [Megachile rotundata]XP_012147313.1 PREDICTED: small integral membrane protein 14 [Megachile rotundata]XP_012147314.1 PREDICTED: small integral membrane protein 14 [Megachile rotundata]